MNSINYSLVVFSFTKVIFFTVSSSIFKYIFLLNCSLKKVNFFSFLSEQFMLKFSVGFIIKHIISTVFFSFFSVNLGDLYCFNLVPSGTLPVSATKSDMEEAYNRLANVVSVGRLAEARDALVQLEIMHSDPRWVHYIDRQMLAENYEQFSARQNNVRVK